MAGDWIKFETATPDKPEVWAIAGALNVDPDAVVGKLLRVWGWFDQHTESGNAPSVSKLLLNRLVGVPGFCEEVIKAGWLHDDGKTLSIAKFDRHNGETAKTRALTAKRVAKHKNKGNGDANDEVTGDALPREDIDKDKKTKPKRARNAFAKPTHGELVEYLNDKVPNASAEATKFLNHFETVGWLVGKARNPMHNWKTAASGWADRSNEYAKQNGQQRNPAQRNSRPSLSDRAQAAADEVFGADAGEVLEGNFTLVDEHAPAH